MGTTTRLQILTSFLFTVCLAERAINSYDPEFGVYLGEFADPDAALSGHLFLVNESCLQVLNFTFHPTSEAFFWIDSTDSPSKDGFKLPTFEFGVTPLGLYENTERVVLHLPQRKRITEFKTVSIYSPSEKQTLASITIPSDVTVPKSQFIGKELSGLRYGVGSGPILIQDRRTIKIFAFTFDADKAPDGYFFVGRGGIVVHDAGVKVPIRGRDTPTEITPMNQRYRGGEDIILDLPKEYDINHIDWLSVYCYKFRVDFGHVFVGKVGDYIPPYVPPVKREVAKIGVWKPQALLGSPTRTSFVLQLGPPGGRRGFQGITGLSPPELVWYVNGYLAEIYLKRGFNYSFVLEGGSNHSFYLSDDQFGGIDKLEPDERMVKVFAPSKIQTPSDKLCLWETDESDPDRFESFAEFRKTLHLRCLNKEAKATVLSFMPDKGTPNVIYGNTASEYNTGFKIHVVDEFPADIEDINEEPFESDAWVNRTNSASSLLPHTFIIALVAAWLSL
uniref:Protein Skeletor n=1 Tax=Bursaphelenchus xylophilus TaxID=6326 RepID=A0A1I7SQN0_BURXY